MPGSRPGEHRGGRQKGTQNKANAEKQLAIDQALALAFAEYSHEFIDNLRPAQLQLIAMGLPLKPALLRRR
jgi:hypothetical protein